MTTKRITLLIGTSTISLALSLFWVLGLTDSKPFFGAHESVVERHASSVRAVRMAPDSRVTFLAVGDIMLSRGVDRAIDHQRNASLPFSKLADLFESVDFSFGNFESPVSGNDHRLGKGLVFNAHRPDVDGIIKYKIRVVNLANNHALDQGVNGLRSTIGFLNGRGIETIGVGENKDDAWRGKVIDAGGIRIGFLGASYASVNDGGALTNRFVARIEDRDHLRNEIARLKSESELIVVTMHAGVEYTRRPVRSQIEFARRAIDLGADIVIGSHPHWIQTVEQYRGKYIFYSLGNFIFDQRKTDTKEGLMLRITVGTHPSPGHLDESSVQLEQIDLIPVVIEHVGIPQPATEDQTIAILKKIDMVGRTLIPVRADQFAK